MSTLGTSKITQGGKIQLITDVRKHLKVDIGDIIIFEKTKNNEIYIRKG